MNLNKRDKIFWCNGSMGRDKKNPMALKVKMIAPDGRVVEASLATGKTITDIMHSPYGQLKERLMAHRGWVKYDDMEEVEREKYIAECKAKQTAKGADFGKVFVSSADRFFEEAMKTEADPAAIRALVTKPKKRSKVGRAASKEQPS